MNSDEGRLDAHDLDLAAVASPGQVVILQARRKVPPDVLTVTAERLRVCSESTGVRFVLLDHDLAVARISAPEASE